MISLTLTLALTLGTGSLNHEKAAFSWFERHDVTETDPSKLVLDELFDQKFARVALGLFDIRMPASTFDEKDDFEAAQQASMALIDGQAQWLRWLVDGDIDGSEAVEAAIEDLEDLKRWVKGWRLSKLRKAYEDGRRDLAPDPEEDDIGSVIESLSGWMARGGPIGLARTEPRSQQIFLMPNRQEFVEIACVLGWATPHLRPNFWMEGLWGWTQFYFFDKKFFALQFARAPFNGDYTAGDPMERYNKTGLEQQVVQLGMNALFDNYYGDRLSPDIGSGMASNIVIDIYGEVDTRTDGDLRARSTQAREVFVPGANVADGSLGANYADGRFRSPDNGSDRFVKALRLTQKAGARNARSKSDKFRSFELLTDDESDDFTFLAPCFDPSAAKQNPPGEAFQGDLLEFLRAYRICFLSWMRDHGANKKNASRESFAQLLVELGKVNFGEACQKAYGSAMSSEDLGKSTLEGEFLRWLAKQ